MYSPELAPSIRPDAGVEQNLTLSIAEAASFDQLYEILESAPEIKGSSTYTGTDVAKLVRAYVNKERAIFAVTKANGIREAVLRLSGLK